MNSQSQGDPSGLESVFAALTHSHGPDFVAQIRPTIRRNVRLGRFRVFARNHANAQLQEYAEFVAATFERLQPHLEKVQITRDHLVWNDLHDKLRQWAFQFLYRKTPLPGQELECLCQVCATLATIEILKADFPFDTEFDPWARELLKNVCRHEVRRRSKGINREQQLGPDEQLSDQDTPGHSALITHQELCHDLYAAVCQLTPPRREVILLRYCHGWTFLAIATSLNRSVGAIHSLHFKALGQLRGILTQSGYNSGHHDREPSFPGRPAPVESGRAAVAACAD